MLMCQCRLRIPQFKNSMATPIGLKMFGYKQNRFWCEKIVRIENSFDGKIDCSTQCLRLVRESAGLRKNTLRIDFNLRAFRSNAAAF